MVAQITMSNNNWVHYVLIEVTVHRSAVLNYIVKLHKQLNLQILEAVCLKTDVKMS